MLLASPEALLCPGPEGQITAPTGVPVQAGITPANLLIARSPVPGPAKVQTEF